MANEMETGITKGFTFSGGPYNKEYNVLVVPLPPVLAWARC